MVKWIREWTRDPEVGVQVQDKVSKKESLEYSIKCVDSRGSGYEGMQGGGHLEDRGDGKMREG